MSGKSFLEAKIDEIRTRLTELTPAYNEYVALQHAVEAIGGSLPRRELAVAAPKQPARAKAPRRGKKRRPAGTLRKSMLAVIAEKPGLTGAELSGELGSARPTIVTLAKKLEQEGLLERRRVQVPSGARIGYFSK